LTDLGNSVIIIEHNLDVIRNADWVIDLGPEGGEDGGRIVGQGRPAKIAATPESYTGQFLRRFYTSRNGQLMEADVEEEPSVDTETSVADPVEPPRTKAKKTGNNGAANARKKKTGRP